MATINQNSINFTNVQPSNIFTTAGKYSVNANDDGTGKFDTTLTGSEITKSLNAIEIDWNNAQLQSAVQSLESNLQEGLAVSEINTSGELIKVIAQLQAQVNTLTTLVKGLYNAIQTQP